ncbi:MAG: tail fiber domain-containing protein, partial [Bdellovibrionaceae bacterium]|nr:tail fiber domain-containing protein [Pseudobdellovibrionaceae bacterium]
ISLRAPDTLAANYALTLPAATGSTGQFLATDGAGNLSWATNPGGTLGWVQGGNSFGQTGTLGTNDNQDLALRTNGTTRLHITNSGYVGIGTTSGTHALNVNGNINLMNATDSIRLNGNAIFSRYPGQWGHINTFIGTERPMSSLNTAMAWGNLAIGYDSGNSLTLGGGNTSVGIYSSRNVTDAINNTAIGFSALSGTGVGSGNTVIGSHALNNSTNATTGGNTAVGAHALHQLTSGVDITAIGNSAGYDLQTGGHNLFIGRGAGAGLVNGARNIFIGSSNLTAPTGTMNDFMTIGNLIYGRSMTGTGTTSAGRVGIRTDDPQAVLDVFGTGADSAMLIPRDTTANRPTGVDGMIRYNSQTSKFEGFQAGLWTDMIASGAGTLGWAQGGNSFGQTGTLGTNDNQPLVFETNNVARMTLGTNGFLGIGSIAPINGLTIGAANNPDLSAISVVNTDSSTARYPSVVAVNYMGSANLGHPMLAVVNSRGNYGGPAPVVAGDTLGALEFRGRLANYTELPGAGILGLAEQNFATGVAGSYLSFRTTNLNAGALSEKMRITANGNVGIGITAPSGLLHVEGGEIIAGPVATGAGNSGRLQLRELAANGTNGVSLRAADAMAANYTLTLPAATGTSGQLLMTDGAGNLGWATNTGGTLNWSQGGNSFGQTGTLGTNDSHPLALRTAGTTRMTINSGGSVGIGTDTPVATLNVNGSAQIERSLTVYNHSANVYSPNGSAMAPEGGGHWFYNPSATAGAASSLIIGSRNGTGYNHAYLGAVAPASGYTPSIVIGQQTAATTYAERLRIDANGYMGLGTTAPSGRLHVRNTGTTMPSLSTDTEIIVQNNSGASSQAGISIIGGTTGYSSIAMGDGAAQYRAWIGSDNANSALRFGTGLNEQARIAADGKMGLGTAVPTELLHLSGGNMLLSPVSAGAGNTARLRMRELVANGSHAVSLRAPDSIAADFTLTLPAATGSSGQLLTTDGSGNLGWVNNTGGTLNWSQGGNSFGQTGTLGTNDNNALAFRTNNNTRMTITPGGAVGIGTSNPDQTLTVEDTTFVGISIKATNGYTHAFPGLNIDAYQGGSFAGHPRINFFNARGSEASTNPTPAGLHLGVVNFMGYTGSDAEFSSAIYAVSDATFTAGSSPSSLVFTTTPSGSTSSTERMIIKGSGNVGIGTTAPSGRLHVDGGEIIAGPIAAGAGNSGRLQLRELAVNGTNGVSLRAADTMASNYTLTLPAGTGTNGQILQTDASGNLSWVTNSGGTTNWAQGGNSFGQTGTIGTNDNQALAFETNNNTRMFINSGGSVAIGTGTPEGLMDVRGMLSIGPSHSGINNPNSVLVARSPDTFNPHFILEKVGQNTGGFALDNNNFIMASEMADITFRTGVNYQGDYTTTGSEVMRIKNNGNVGIGETDPDDMLHISAAPGEKARARFSAWGGIYHRHYSIGTDGSTSTIDPPYFDFSIRDEDAGQDRLTVAWSSGYVGIGEIDPDERLHVNGNVLATAYLYSSDVRLKKDFVLLDHSLEKLLELEPVTYRWIHPQNPEADREQIGLKAQQVRDVYPQAVREDDKGFLRLDYPALIAPVIKAIQELYYELVGVKRSIASKAEQTDVDALKADNEAKDREIRQLKQENEAIKGWICAKDPNAELCR